MGCPNKKYDEMIIAEVERRKAMKTAEPIQTTWEGSLFEFLASGIMEEAVLKIERIGDVWLIDLKE